tara:strand:- start:331 stop:1320 length:990 start_codon:yes stop_codon:yes gene_type:complete
MNKVLQIKDQVLSYVKRAGPVLPVKVKKSVGTSTLFISALLSELTSGKQIKISKAKIGGSPLYYALGQEEKLGTMLRDHLKEFPKKAFDLLQEHKVLRERDQEPAIRVALKEIPDFAKPIPLNIKGNVENFWKWYLVKDDEAKELIEGILQKLYGEAKPETPIPEEPKAEEPKQQELPKPVKEEPKVELVKEELVEEKPKVEPEPVKEEPVEEEPKQAKLPKPQIQDDFAKTVIAYLNENNINIENITVVRKNREINFLVKIPTDIGNLAYMVKAKNKKKLNEGELLLAFTEAQNEKLPLIFLTNGETTKKAQEYMIKNMKGLVFKRLK